LEKLLKLKKNGKNFLFWNIFFFILEIFMFLYANEEGDDVISGSTRVNQEYL